ncbi:PREDICTED: coiled-coil domain-containing protein 147-like [Ceratosolen solmsi marchali]|uniref:Coiled-coil domain-containing protein 147-like n=1 Tax=Ceratosolen solmsi marchali TaxID=326594 RepID=A0AAJ7DZ08_9HYME|nr:PREDICTED: coiled-coil domain-containing protein 147-like [Ceratosolen solmsi marchali]
MMDMEMNADMEREEGSETGGGSNEGSSTGSMYCTLEQNFEQIRNAMKNNRALESYEHEYKRLFESLYQSHRSEDELTKKCKTLQEEVAEGMNKIFDLEKKVEIGEMNIEQLKNEIIEKKKHTDIIHVREQKAQEIIENLRISIAKLTEEINQKSKQLSTEEQLPPTQEKDGLTKENERLLGEVDALKQCLKNAANYNQEIEEKVNETEEKIKSLQETIDQQNNDMLKVQREREKTQSELDNLYEKFIIRSTELQTVDEAYKEMQNNALKQEQLLSDQVMENEKSQKELHKVTQQVMSMKKSSDNLQIKITQIEKELNDKSRLIKDLNKEMHGKQKELERLNLEKENTESKLTKERNLNMKTEENLKRNVTILKNSESEVAGLTKCIESDKKTIEKLNRFKETASKNIKEQEEIIMKLNYEIRVFEQTNRRMQTTEDEMTAAANEMRRHIKKLETDKNKCVIETQELTVKVKDCVDELKLKRLEIADYQKRLHEADNRFRQHQTVFDNIRAERNSFKKNLLLVQEEVVELKAKAKNLNLEINVLKDQLAIKEADLMKQEFLFNKLEKEKDGLKVEITNIRINMSNFREEMEKMKQEEKFLKKTLQEADLTIIKQTKEIELIMNERDIIGTQIVRRNDEISLQYNKMQILTETLAGGEKQYTQRMDEIRTLKLELKNLKLRNAALEKHTSSLNDLRDAVSHLERNLNKERLKVMALEEEVQNPLNIHRWRSLEGTDPDTFELLKKIQILQKRIVKMSTEMINKDKKIREIEKLYTNLRKVLAKQPGPEILVHLNKTRRALRDRGNKMKSLVAELNMAISTEHKFEIDKIKKELNITKAKYFAQKKKNLKPLEYIKQIPATLTVNPNKFHYSGFDVNNPTSKDSTISSTVITQ